MTDDHDRILTSIGVVGGGRMGSGIAHAFLSVGVPVTLIEADEAAAGRALAEVTRLLEASARRGSLAEPLVAVSERLRVSTAHADLRDAALVIEAVPEIDAIKTVALTGIEASVGAATVIASNTSSMSITDLGTRLGDPTRFIGMHYFNPVPASSLVEVVLGARTSDAARELVLAATARIGKEPIVVQDSPGFASSRLGLALGLEAIRMVESGVASPTDIDTAMTLGYKYPVGPLRLTDLVGLDVRLDIADYLHARLGARFEPPQLLRDMVARGELGRKSGRGFFTWED